MMESSVGVGATAAPRRRVGGALVATRPDYVSFR